MPPTAKKLKPKLPTAKKLKPKLPLNQSRAGHHLPLNHYLRNPMMTITHHHRQELADELEALAYDLKTAATLTYADVIQRLASIEQMLEQWRPTDEHLAEILTELEAIAKSLDKSQACQTSPTAPRTPKTSQEQ
jgi:exoribonuclease II